MADIFDQIHQQQQAAPPPAKGDVFDQIHAQQQPSAVSRFGQGVYDSTIGGAINTIEHPLDSGKALLGLPELKSIAALAQNGHLAPAAILAAHWLSNIGNRATGVQGALDNAAEGNVAGAAGNLTGTGLMAALGSKGPDLVQGGIDTVQGGLQKLPPGLLKTGAATGGAMLGHTLGRVLGEPYLGAALGGYAGKELGGLLLKHLDSAGVPAGFDPAAWKALPDLEKSLVLKSLDPAYLASIDEANKPNPQPMAPRPQAPPAAAPVPESANPAWAPPESPIKAINGQPLPSMNLSPAEYKAQMRALFDQAYSRTATAADQSEAAARPVIKPKPSANGNPAPAATNGNGSTPPAPVPINSTPPVDAAIPKAPEGAKVDGAPIGRTKEYAAMLKNWTVDPASFPGAKPGDAFQFRSGVAPKSVRTFPANQLEALGAKEGITAEQARTKLKADGWLVVNQ